MRRLLLPLLPLLFVACTSWNRSAPGPALTAETPDAPPLEMGYAGDDDFGIRAARWHLLRAEEARVCSQFTQAQQDLDRAFRILAALEAGDSDGEAAQKLGVAVESAYLRLLPRLERFSPNSPLTLLLQGLSEEKIENLPDDATQLVRIHQLSQRSDMPIDANAKVAASIHFFQTRGRTTFETWMRRSGRFRDLIIDILRQEEVPRDLLYIAMIESGFNPHAYSRARAVGLWQFIEYTGRLQGLQRNHWVDQRRDPIKSTRAAARHMKALYGHFQDWRLAIAAYNAGQGRVSRAMARAGTRDFWKLDLPRETENYVPLFMAAAVIAKDPPLFGFDLGEPDPPFSFDAVTLPPGQPYADLKVAAESMGTTYAVLRALNPELRQRITPPQGRQGSGYRLRVPKGKGETFLKRYASLPRVDAVALYEYVVQPRDNLSSIAQAFGIPSRLVVDANSIVNPNRIYPGQRLYIPAAPGVKLSAAHEKQTYVIRPGDSLSRIARRYGVRLRDLMQWNGLRSPLIHPGDRLTVWKPRPSKPEKASRPQPQKSASGQRQHTVQPGETLWGLSRAFGVTVAQLQEWNELPGALIRPGQQLVVGLPDPGADEQLYTVVKGDTLYSIARRFGLHAHDLARQNNISLSSALLTGTTLKISTRSAE